MAVQWQRRGAGGAWLGLAAVLAACSGGAAGGGDVGGTGDLVSVTPDSGGDGATPDAAVPDAGGGADAAGGDAHADAGQDALDGAAPDAQPVDVDGGADGVVEGDAVGDADVPDAQVPDAGGDVDVALPDADAGGPKDTGPPKCVETVSVCVGDVLNVCVAGEAATSQDCAALGLPCWNGECFEGCIPHCEGKVCGDDGCGESCGTCEGQDVHCIEGQCIYVCPVQCNGKECGDDGCGGTCGSCADGEGCFGGVCFPATGSVCDGQCGGFLPEFGCGCDPLCATFDACCPGFCGSCGQIYPEACDCTGSCEGLACGNDGCGGSCGVCPEGEACFDGQCAACTPACGGKVCGPDGCGGSCGACSEGKCVGGACAVCTPACDGVECGDDGCGGSCGTCAVGACVLGQCDDGGAWPWSCGDVADVPVPFHTLTGFTTSEDFDFGPDGYVYAASGGAVVKQALMGTAAGPKIVVAPLSGNFIAGMGFLPTGELVVCNVSEGALDRVDVVTGQVTTILSGLNYPNGMSVHWDGSVFVAEQSADRLRRVDPWTGEFTTIGENVTAANGVAFAPGYKRVYVGSFGAGKIFASDQDDEGNWGTPYVWGYAPPSAAPPSTEPKPPSCPPGSVGLACLNDGGNDGYCTEALACEAPFSADVAEDACAGLEAGAMCAVQLPGLALPGACAVGNFGGLACDLSPAINDYACAGSTDGAWCIGVDSGQEIAWGLCKPNGTGLRCDTNVGQGGGGGLDGLNVDGCGYVYVTHFGPGIIYRITPDGKTTELAADVPAGWIPNMKWSDGTGGFDPNVLYVADRDQGRIFGLEIGIPGAPATAPVR